MNAPLPGRVLVVTPTLGQTELLALTVASVACQRARILHLLVAPAAKVSGLQARFPSTCVVADAGREGGIYGALNAALTAAPADWDWFTYINDDDVLLPGAAEMLAGHVAAARRDTVLYGDVDLIDDAGRVLSQITTERSPRWIGPLLQEEISPLMQQGMMIRAHVVRRLRGFDTRYRLCADLDFWLRAYAAGEAFRHYPLRVAQFRVRRGQLSGATAMTEREQAEIVRRHLPVARPAWERRFARCRYRVLNLPRYLARIRARGLRTSYEVLQQEGARS